MAPSWTQTIDNVFTSTWAKRLDGGAIEQAFEKTPLAFWMKQAGRVESISGYRRIEIPLDYASNETFRWIGKGDPVPATETEFLTMAYEDWKYGAVSVLRYGVDDHQNRGAASLINYAEAKMKAAERAYWEELERVFFADGTGTNEPNGFQNLIAASPLTGTVHGLNRATYSWFRNQYKSATGVCSLYLASDLRNLCNTCMKYSGVEISDLFFVTDQTTYEAYEDEVMEQKMIVNQKLADAMFENVVFKGRPLFWSPQAPSAKVYVVNPSYIKLVVDNALFMTPTEWKTIPEQPNDRVMQIVSALQMITSRPVAMGVLTGLTY